MCVLTQSDYVRIFLDRKVRDTMKQKRRTIFLSILWLASYLLLGIGLFVYIAVVTAFGDGFATNALPVEYMHFAWIVSICYLLPLAIWIHVSARKAQMRALKVISMIGMIILSVWTVIAGVSFGIG